MTIAAAVTEAKNGTALLAECRRCLSLGVDLKAHYIKHVVDLIENATIASLAAWTDVTPDTGLDGRSTVEAAVIA
jgi:hypothetical protein